MERLKISSSGPRWALAFAFLTIVIVLVASSDSYRFGRFLCRNFKNTWIATSGYITCYRAP